MNSDKLCLTKSPSQSQSAALPSLIRLTCVHSADKAGLTKVVRRKYQLLFVINTINCREDFGVRKFRHFCLLISLPFCRGLVQAENIVVSLVTPSAAYMDHFVAIEKGYFREQNLNVEYIRAGGGVAKTTISPVTFLILPLASGRPLGRSRSLPDNVSLQASTRLHLAKHWHDRQSIGR